MRIRRICNYIKNYDKHFCRRGYREAKLKTICENVRKMSREELVTYKKKDKSNRFALGLPFHHKHEGIQQVLQKSYNKMITCNPEVKQIFPDPPMISFRQAPNIRDKVVRANQLGHKSYQPMLPPEGKSCIADLINHSKIVTNAISNRTCYIEGDNANTVGAIYSALCKNIGNCMLDKQGSHSTRDSTATAQMQFTTLTDPI